MCVCLLFKSTFYIFFNRGEKEVDSLYDTTQVLDLGQIVKDGLNGS